MRIAVIGGKLQGVEALYLAGKAGFQTVLIDKNPAAIAVNLCDIFIPYHFSDDHPIPPACPPVDLILPATENLEVLEALKIWAEATGIPLAFDHEAYSLTRSKILSDRLFHDLNLPAPRPWPDCDLPVIAKPDDESGSRGVEILATPELLQHYLSEHSKKGNVVIQEYIAGSSYSIEVIGVPGNYRALQVTELHMDDIHDCKRVTTPSSLSEALIDSFEHLAMTLAQETRLKGLMDVEVILNENQLKLLEIDARIPSQTPMAVFWSTGINMVEMLGEIFTGHENYPCELENTRHSSVEHILVRGNSLEVCGEHIMSTDGPLTLHPHFLGADEALTTYRPGRTTWVATLIFVSDSREELETRRTRCHTAIRQLQSTPREEEH